MYADYGFFFIVDCFAFLEDMLLCLLVVATSPAYLGYPSPPPPTPLIPNRHESACILRKSGRIKDAFVVAIFNVTVMLAYQIVNQILV